MTNELDNINKLIEKTTKEIEIFNENKKELLNLQSALEKDDADAHKKLDDATKEITAQIKALEEKRSEISAPILAELDTINNKQFDMRHKLNEGESKSTSLVRMEKLKTVLEKIADDYFIIIADKWGENIVLGRHYKNNYRPDGWTIIDIFIKGTSVYCRSDIAKNPRKLFDTLKQYRWSVVLSKDKDSAKYSNDSEKITIRSD